MGGRSAFGDQRKRESRADREMWIREVSDSRLRAYDRLTVSGGFDERANGDVRHRETQSYFSGLVQSEMKRRGL